MRVLALMGGLAALLVVVVLVGVLAIGGGGDAEVTAPAAASPAAPAAPDCPSSGPFVCITSVRQGSSGGLEAEFATVDVRPTNPGAGRTHLVFFLADVVRADHGPVAVAAGAPIEWGASVPFQGWTSNQLAARTAVCALVVSDGVVLPGTGNCRSLP